MVSGFWFQATERSRSIGIRFLKNTLNPLNFLNKITFEQGNIRTREHLNHYFVTLSGVEVLNLELRTFEH